MQIYDELHTDHLKVLNLIDELLDLPDDGDEEYRSNLISDIRDELIPHSRAEERVFYNSIRMLDGTSQVRHSYREHMEAEALLRTLQVENKMGIGWRGAAEKLRDAIAHHIREEETSIWSIAKQLFSDAEADMMGKAFARLKPKIRDEGFMQTTLDMVANLMPPRLTRALRGAEARY